ncbi:hypothetical protein [Andreprevotia chitinilytica]|uniref:hypothetical protein n=1 Tax=Andreprevotia chitinilytica TaxID=396808 RepID=UPI0012EBED52|nr:hypothetical protein [Andreprevotia chitinilytica]
MVEGCGLLLDGATTYAVERWLTWRVSTMQMICHCQSISASKRNGRLSNMANDWHGVHEFKRTVLDKGNAMNAEAGCKLSEIKYRPD